MSGRIDLNWNGRDITIERSSKARQPLGVFRAYETETGLEIPELTADNCGQTLLGIERNVFTKAGFLRFTDLPVAQDEALRKRLNALVTTGDESGAAELLVQKLRDLKNKCRYNRSGLLPAAEKQREDLRSRLEEQTALTSQIQQLRGRQTELETQIADLKNHKAALDYAAAREDARRLEEATAARDAALARRDSALAACKDLPRQEDARRALSHWDSYRRDLDRLIVEEQTLPFSPEDPKIPDIFVGIHPEEAVTRAQADQAAFSDLKDPKKPSALPAILGGAALIAAAVLFILKLWPIAIAAVLLAAGGVAAHLVSKKKYRAAAEKNAALRQALLHRYGQAESSRWLALALAYRDSMAAYQRDAEAFRRAKKALDDRRADLTAPQGDPEYWKECLAAWDALADAQRELAQAEKYLQTLAAMAKSAAPPAAEDILTFSEPETLRLLQEATTDLQLLHRRLGQYQGQAEALGDAEGMKKELEQAENRIQKLEQTYAALELALGTLDSASAELQRRFAPRISRQAQELFRELTEDRYQTLTLANDLSLHAAAEGEDTLHSHQWRSDGTIDQLYLALRLAVARELTPEAPLILDDALVRFDDKRLAAALKILRREAEGKQVILFTCQGRENAL
jgi:uncharacterized protein YhaN